MQVINSSVKVEFPERLKGALERLEIIARNCYKSEERIGPGTALRLIKGTIMKKKHYPILEHESATVRFICNRGVSHELVRHRIASYAQESTRYVNYGKKGLQFIQPTFKKNYDKNYETWLGVMQVIEQGYNQLLKDGAEPQEARGVLPIDVKTEIIATLNLRQWLWVFSQRLSIYAHPHIRKLFAELLPQFKKLIPIIFDGVSEPQFEVDNQDK